MTFFQQMPAVVGFIFRALQIVCKSLTASRVRDFGFMLDQSRIDRIVLRRIRKVMACVKKMHRLETVGEW